MKKSKLEEIKRQNEKISIYSLEANYLHLEKMFLEEFQPKTLE